MKILINKNTIMYIVIGILITVTIFQNIIFLLHDCNEKADHFDCIIKDPSAEKIPLPDNVTSRPIFMQGFTFMEVEAGASIINVGENIKNLKENNVYLVATIYVEGKEIYRSGFFAPGEMIGEISIGPLQKGIYDAKLIYDTYRIEDGMKVNGLIVEFDMIVH